MYKWIKISHLTQKEKIKIDFCKKTWRERMPAVWKKSQKLKFNR